MLPISLFHMNVTVNVTVHFFYTNDTVNVIIFIFFIQMLPFIPYKFYFVSHFYFQDSAQSGECVWSDGTKQ